MSGGDTHQADVAFCADLVRSHDYVRYASTLFVPSDRRRGLLALYAFNVEIARVREQVTQPLPGEIRLQWWSDMLSGTGQGGIEGNPVAAELTRAIDQFVLPVGPLSRLIEEHQFDLYNDPMPTMAALEGYVTDTASALFATAVRIAGLSAVEVEHVARHAGLAQGFAEVIAALPRDASRRQLFVPQQLLESRGGDMEEIFSGKPTPTIRAVLDELITEAEQHLENSLALLSDMPRDVTPIFLPLAVTRRELERMSRADFNPFTPYVRSHLSVLWTLWRASKSAAFRGR
jgi:15-cis-phytoene synthase